MAYKTRRTIELKNRRRKYQINMHTQLDNKEWKQFKIQLGLDGMRIGDFFTEKVRDYLE